MKKSGIIFLFLVCVTFAGWLPVILGVTGDVVTGEAITGKATSWKINATVNVFSLVNFSIVSPENTTYVFNSGDDIVLDLNVSYTNDSVPTNWTYTLKDLWTGAVINQSAPFTPNTTIYPNANSHNLTVSVMNEAGVISTQSVVFFIESTNTAPVITLNDDEVFVCEDSSLNYKFNVSDAEDGGISVGISPVFPFLISSESEYFEGTRREITLFSIVLQKEYIGIHPLEISASDGESSDVENLNVTVMEINHAPDVENLGVVTLWSSGENRTYYNEVGTYDLECACDQTSGNFSYNLTFLNGVTPFFNVSDKGIINFTANENYLGPNNESSTYNTTLCVTDFALENPHENISLCGQDGLNITVCRSLNITVTLENRAPYISRYSPTPLAFSAQGTDSLLFNISDFDPDGTIPDTYWYIDGAFAEYDAGSNYDTFSHSFGCGVSGLHTVSVDVTDGLVGCYDSSDCNASLQWIIFVGFVDCPAEESPGGGGGSGGGGGGCVSQWACYDWNNCEKSSEGLARGILEGDSYREILSNCTVLGLGEENCGYQTRDCSDLNNCSHSLPYDFKACYYSKNPSCADGIKNCHDGSCEFMVDCGGPCGQCPTCSDGLQNQGEYGVDCGGPCPGECLPETPIKSFSAGLVYLFIGLVLVAILIIKLYQTIMTGRIVFAEKENVKN
jgi:hypothetical protein